VLLSRLLRPHRPLAQRLASRPALDVSRWRRREPLSVTQWDRDGMDGSGVYGVVWSLLVLMSWLVFRERCRIKSRGCGLLLCIALTSVVPSICASYYSC
jgi:hypothetical protein